MKNWTRDNKLLVAITTAVVLLCVALLYAGKERTKPPVKIGVLHSLTGTMASSETPLVDALRLAVEEANQAGGVNGSQIEMVVVDCRSDAAYCAQQAEKLITQDGVKALFGCWTSACRKAVGAVVEKHHHLLFYPLQYEGLELSPDIIYTGATPNQQTIPMVNWAMQQYGKRVFMVGSDYVFPYAVNQIIKKLLIAQGGQLLAEHYVPLEGQDMSAIVAAIVKQQPDFIVNTLNGESNRYFFKALHEAGIDAEKVPVFSTSIAESQLAMIGPELVAGHYAAWSYFQSLPGDENRAFIERFRRRFGSQRVIDDPMEASYIGMKLWVNAVYDTGTLDFANLKTHLGMDTLPAPEGIVTVDVDTHHLWKHMRIGRAKADGQFEIVWQSGRTIMPAPFPFFIPLEELQAIAGGK